jgi:hypothetical protein
MKRQNPFNNFLFSVPGKHGKMTLEELKVVKNINVKTVEVIDTQTNRRLGRMSGLSALLKFS